MFTHTGWGGSLRHVQRSFHFLTVLRISKKDGVVYLTKLSTFDTVQDPYWPNSPIFYHSILLLHAFRGQYVD